MTGARTSPWRRPSHGPVRTSDAAGADTSCRNRNHNDRISSDGPVKWSSNAGSIVSSSGAVWPGGDDEGADRLQIAPSVLRRSARHSSVLAPDGVPAARPELRPDRPPSGEPLPGRGASDHDVPRQTGAAGLQRRRLGVDPSGTLPRSHVVDGALRRLRRPPVALGRTGGLPGARGGQEPGLQLLRGAVDHRAGRGRGDAAVHPAVGVRGAQDQPVRRPRPSAAPRQLAASHRRDSGGGRARCPSPCC